MLQSSRRNPGGSPTPGVVIPWRMRTTWPPPFSSVQRSSAVAAEAAAGSSSGEHEPPHGITLRMRIITARGEPRPSRSLVAM